MNLHNRHAPSIDHTLLKNTIRHIQRHKCAPYWAIVVHSCGQRKHLCNKKNKSSIMCVRFPVAMKVYAARGKMVSAPSPHQNSSRRVATETTKRYNTRWFNFFFVLKRVYDHEDVVWSACFAPRVTTFA